jgi:hypothetical protein
MDIGQIRHRHTSTFRQVVTSKPDPHHPPLPIPALALA